MKKIYKAILALSVILFVCQPEAAYFQYFLESSSIEEMHKKDHSVIVKEKHDDLHLNTINDLKVNISSRDNFMIEVKPGFHDINANFFKGSYFRGRTESKPLTRRYYFKPGKIYLLSSQTFNEKCLFYFKEYSLQKVNKETVSIIKKTKELFTNFKDSAPSFESLDSVGKFK